MGVKFIRKKVNKKQVRNSKNVKRIIIEYDNKGIRLLQGDEIAFGQLAAIFYVILFEILHNTHRQSPNEIFDTLLDLLNHTKDVAADVYNK